MSKRSFNKELTHTPYSNLSLLGCRLTASSIASKGLVRRRGGLGRAVVGMPECATNSTPESMIRMIDHATTVPGTDGVHPDAMVGLTLLSVALRPVLSLLFLQGCLGRSRPTSKSVGGGQCSSAIGR